MVNFSVNDRWHCGRKNKGHAHSMYAPAAHACYLPQATHCKIIIIRGLKLKLKPLLSEYAHQLLMFDTDIVNLD